VTIDILLLCWNRLEMTSAVWAWMMAHTNWDLVERLVVYDDGSEDGTLEFLRENAHPFRRKDRMIDVELRLSNFGSPPAAMNHYLATSEADVFAKIDNDIALPGGWLDKMAAVMKKHPELELLGMEAGMVAMQGRDGVVYPDYDIEPCTNIGGVGLMRVSAFRARPEIPYRGRFGFTEWQERYSPSRAWIVPDLDVPQLDRLPCEPWVTLTETYIEKGWSRPWGKYEEKWMAPYWAWMET
jgi:glycosyltransferase involved in cell wall biosynthesis